ncbi:response regulator [Rubripirellula reticaptiva]|uniref:Response regulator rcp1 n=1 Tax=Rubripirellula reticaptiva TaxID=2528013 RepID=A0A5C6ECT7_9BACT|nr:response regulator [Rubripirellula reticaptiva]TWU46728.1 Response regulator rcp1 [Rubripirellula reticaptiva]
MTSEVFNVLLVEDNDDDFALAREGFRRTRVEVCLHHVTNGVECMRYLRKTEKFANSPTPDLVLLDLNMPVMDGREVLAEIAKDDSLKRLPVVVLTTSSSMVDTMISYQLGCNAYVVKPVDIHDFQQAIDRLCEFWLETVKRPCKTN